MDKPYYENFELFSLCIKESLEQGAKKVKAEVDPVEERPYCD